MPANPQWNKTDDAERAIDQSPKQRNTADGTANKRGRDDQDTGNHTEFDDPDIFYRIAQRPDKGNGNGNMGKGQPIGAVRNKRIGSIGLRKTFVYVGDPIGKGWEKTFHKSAGAEPLIQKAGLPLQRKSSQAAQNKGNDEE